MSSLQMEYLKFLSEVVMSGVLQQASSLSYCSTMACLIFQTAVSWYCITSGDSFYSRTLPNSNWANLETRVDPPYACSSSIIASDKYYTCLEMAPKVKIKGNVNTASTVPRSWLLCTVWRDQVGPLLQRLDLALQSVSTFVKPLHDVCVALVVLEVQGSGLLLRLVCAPRVLVEGLLLLELETQLGDGLLDRPHIDVVTESLHHPKQFLINHPITLFREADVAKESLRWPCLRLKLNDSFTLQTVLSQDSYRCVISQINACSFRTSCQWRWTNFFLKCSTDALKAFYNQLSLEAESLGVVELACNLYRVSVSNVVIQSQSGHGRLDSMITCLVEQSTHRVWEQRRGMNSHLDLPHSEHIIDWSIGFIILVLRFQLDCSERITSLLDSREEQLDCRMSESSSSTIPPSVPKSQTSKPKLKRSEWDFLLDEWHDYFVQTKPQSIDESNTLHQMLITLYKFKKQPFFKDLLVFRAFPSYVEVTLDYHKVMAMEPSTEEETIFKQVIDRLENHPQNILGSLGLALHHQHQKKLRVHLSVSNFPAVDIQSIKPHMVRNFITIKGVVLKVGAIKLLPISVSFKCPQCRSSFPQYLVDGIYEVPDKCSKCKSKVLVCDKTSVKSIRNQRVKIQETESHGVVLEVELRENLVGRVIAGDNVNISGVLRTESDERDKKAQHGILSLVLLGNHLVNERSYTLTEQAEAALRRMRADHHIFISLIKSFCPAIFGHELVKAGLLLGIVGGSSQSMSKGMGFRQSSHILMLGDPGLGKSQLLKFATSLLPNSIYVSGSVVSQSGLTVTVNKDGGESAIEAGALVLCDKGVCGIDQFDKISDSSALLQAMQQQTVSVAKAGIICQLQSRVTIIGSANPIQGNYCKTKSLKDNIKISNAILSRFDLIFLLLDRPDPDRDQKLSQHVMKLHNRTKRSLESTFEYRDEEFKSLADKYEKLGSRATTYSVEQLKHYLSYVKNQVHPELSPQAAQTLKGFYMTLRSENMCSSVPITTRQLESLVRLSMAKARLECRNQVTIDDAEEIVQFMQQSLFDALEDLSTGVNSFKNNLKKPSRAPGEQSIPKQSKLFISRLCELAESKEEPIWEFKELMAIGRELKLSVGDFDLFIDRLNENNTLMLRPGRRYELKIRKL